MGHNFTKFDRELEDLRNEVANASHTVQTSIPRYVAMMKALDSMFALFYDVLPTESQRELKTAFDELAKTVTLFTAKDEVKIVEDKPTEPPKELCGETSAGMTKCSLPRGHDGAHRVRRKLV